MFPLYITCALLSRYSMVFKRTVHSLCTRTVARPKASYGNVVANKGNLLNVIRYYVNINVHMSHCHATATNSSGKFQWQNPTANSSGRFQRQIQVANSSGKFQWQNPVANSSGKFQWQNPTANYNDNNKEDINTYTKTLILHASTFHQNFLSTVPSSSETAFSSPD